MLKRKKTVRLDSAFPQIKLSFDTNRRLELLLTKDFKMTKTFGLVQRGNGRYKQGNGSRSGSVTYKALSSKSTDAEIQEMRYKEIKDRNALDDTMGFEQYTQGPERVGWLVNMHPVGSLQKCTVRYVSLIETNERQTDDRLRLTVRPWQVGARLVFH
jgi:hypothetical protein